jgi:hypothetical protein
VFQFQQQGVDHQADAGGGRLLPGIGQQNDVGQVVEQWAHRLRIKTEEAAEDAGEALAALAGVRHDAAVALGWGRRGMRQHVGNVAREQHQVAGLQGHRRAALDVQPPGAAVDQVEGQQAGRAGDDRPAPAVVAVLVDVRGDLQLPEQVAQGVAGDLAGRNRHLDARAQNMVSQA